MYTSHPLKSNLDQSLDILRVITDECKRVISSMNYNKGEIIARLATITQVKKRFFKKTVQLTLCFGLISRY